MDIDHSYLDYQNIKKKQKEIEESEQQEEIEVNFKQPVLKRIKLPDLKDVNLKLLRRKRFFAHCLPIDLNQTQQDPMNRFEKTPLRLRSDPSTYLLSQKSAISNLKSLNSRNQNSQNTQRIDNLRLRQDSSQIKYDFVQILPQNILKSRRDNNFSRLRNQNHSMIDSQKSQDKHNLVSYSSRPHLHLLQRDRSVISSQSQNKLNLLGNKHDRNKQKQQDNSEQFTNRQSTERLISERVELIDEPIQVQVKKVKIKLSPLKLKKLRSNSSSQVDLRGPITPITVRKEFINKEIRDNVQNSQQVDSVQILKRLKLEESQFINKTFDESILLAGRSKQSNIKLLIPNVLSKEHKFNHLKQLHNIREEQYLQTFEEKIQKQLKDQELDFIIKNVNFKQQTQINQNILQKVDRSLIAAKYFESKNKLEYNYIQQSKNYNRHWSKISQRLMQKLPRGDVNEIQE